MSRRSMVWIRERNAVEAEMPLLSYFASVGGALVCLLLTAGWVLPSQLPDHAIKTEANLPPIRIYSETKKPEAVVIDTTSVPVVGEVARPRGALPGRGRDQEVFAK